MLFGGECSYAERRHCSVVNTRVVVIFGKRCKRRAVIASGLIQCVSIVLKCLVGCPFVYDKTPVFGKDR
jgi:hypothetical protein